MSSLLPRSNYHRLDVDDKDHRSAGAGRMKRFGWKKFAIGAGVLIVVVWLFGPRERRDQVWNGIKNKTPSWSSQPIDDIDYDPLPGPPEPPLKNPTIDEDITTTTTAEPLTETEPATTTPVKTLPGSPHSPEEDPDMMGTVHCTVPYEPGKSLVQYALMIDAGSTGSRIHIYKFNNCGKSPSYEYEVFKQIQPGLSSFRGRPQEAAASLDPLLEEAVNVIPPTLYSCTPVAVKATAGLRLLGTEESADILEAVRRRLVSAYPFHVVEKDGVVIMDGSDEGVYAWITANYLLDSIRADSPKGAPTYAVLDLGGASTQIVFEPTFGDDDDGSTFVDGDHKYDLQFGGKTHVLYQHSYLGYGLMRARSSVHRLAEFVSTFNHAGADAMDGEIPNPCLARETKKVITLEASKAGEVERNVTMAGKDVGGYEACNRLVELVMAKDAICQVKPCSFNGVYQPSILDAFPSGKILLLSYFADRLTPFFASYEARPRLTVGTLSALARDVCLGPSSWKSLWDGNDELLAELEDRPEWCLDLTFMHALLRLGYEFGDERDVRIEKQIDGTELGWCLGATIAMVGADITCRA